MAAPDSHVPFDGNPSAILQNPFHGKRPEEMNALVEAFLARTQLHEIYHGLIRKGAFLAQDRNAFAPERRRRDDLRLDQEEIRMLQKEETSKWDQPWRLYALVATCAMGAAVQGWDETAVNGGKSTFHALTVRRL